MDFTNSTIEFVKEAHNTALREARRQTEIAKAARSEIVQRDENYRGSSLTKLAVASGNLRDARTFKTEG